MQNLEEVSLGGHEDASDPPNLTAYDSKPHSSHVVDVSKYP